MTEQDRSEVDRRKEDQHAEHKRQISDWLRWLFGLGLAALLAYGAMVNTVNSRIAVLETKQIGTEHQLERIENKIDDLLRRP